MVFIILIFFSRTLAYEAGLTAVILEKFVGESPHFPARVQSNGTVHMLSLLRILYLSRLILTPAS